MPTYCYECETCHHTFDRIVKMSDRLSVESEPCPECGVSDVHYRVASPKIVSDVGSLLSKTDNGWKETLSKIKETYKVNNIKT